MREIAIALVIVLSLLSGSVLHATITHDHGHSHSGGETSIWSTLHAGLRHEDKKMVFMLVESVMLATLATIVVVLGTVAFKLVTERAMLRDPCAREALRRGIYRYRVFV